MRTIPLSILIFCAMLGLLAACDRQSDSKEEQTQAPATIVKIPGSTLNEVTLTQDAAKHVGIEMVPLSESTALRGTAMANSSNPPSNTPSSTSSKQVPYSAIIYGLNGETWVYTLLKPLTFVRTPVVVDHIDGDVAVLSSGPAVNTQVVSVGAAELYGSEYIGNIEP